MKAFMRKCYTTVLLLCSSIQNHWLLTCASGSTDDKVRRSTVPPALGQSLGGRPGSSSPVRTSSYALPETAHVALAYPCGTNTGHLLHRIFIRFTLPPGSDGTSLRKGPIRPEFHFHGRQQPAATGKGSYFPHQLVPDLSTASQKQKWKICSIGITLSTHTQCAPDAYNKR